MLEWVDVCTPAGVDRRAPGELGFEYRRSNLEPEAVVSRASFALADGDPEAIKATLAEMRGKRREAQPSGIKTFGSTFKNPEDQRAEGRSAGQLLDAADCRGLQVGGAKFSDKHANFVENTGTATTADILELMSQGRRRVHERFGVVLEPEVQILGEVEWPARLGARRLGTEPAQAGGDPLRREPRGVAGRATTAAGKRARASAYVAGCFRGAKAGRALGRRGDARSRPPARRRNAARPPPRKRGKHARPRVRAGLAAATAAGTPAPSRRPRAGVRPSAPGPAAAGPSLRTSLIVVAVLAIAGTATYFAWFRNSSLVAVDAGRASRA